MTQRLIQKTTRLTTLLKIVKIFNLFVEVKFITVGHQKRKLPLVKCLLYVDKFNYAIHTFKSNERSSSYECELGYRYISET